MSYPIRQGMSSTSAVSINIFDPTVDNGPGKINSISGKNSEISMPPYNNYPVQGLPVVPNWKTPVNQQSPLEMIPASYDIKPQKQQFPPMRMVQTPWGPTIIPVLQQDSQNSMSKKLGVQAQQFPKIDQVPYGMPISPYNKMQQQAGPTFIQTPAGQQVIPQMTIPGVPAPNLVKETQGPVQVENTPTNLESQEAVQTENSPIITNPQEQEETQTGPKSEVPTEESMPGAKNIKEEKTIDVPKIIADLNSNDPATQSDAIQKIASNAQSDDQDVSLPLIRSEVFQGLQSIITADPKKYTDPQMQQKAEENKMIAMWTDAILAKNIRDAMAMNSDPEGAKPSFSADANKSGPQGIALSLGDLNTALNGTLSDMIKIANDKNENPVVRSASLAAIKYIVDPAEQRYADPNDAKTLGPMFLNLLQDPDVNVNRAAIYGLAAIVQPPNQGNNNLVSQDNLFNIFNQIASTSKDTNLRIAAVNGLAEVSMDQPKYDSKLKKTLMMQIENANRALNTPSTANNPEKIELLNKLKTMSGEFLNKVVQKYANNNAEQEYINNKNINQTGIAAPAA